MKFGAHYLPTYVPGLDGSVPEFYRKMFEQIEEMDRLELDHIWVTEHHFGHYGGTLPHPPTFMSAIARTTERIRLGVAVSVLPLHNPIEVAESYAMVDVVSNGRLDFGLGKGSELIEYKRSGVSFEEATGRMKEGTEIIRQAWSDEPVNFRGEFFHYDDVRVLPKPVQRPHPPLWVGCARSEDSFRWAGENGFNLMTLPYLYKEPDLLPGLVRVYRAALARAGHDVTRTQVLGKFHIYVSESLEQAVCEASPYLENYFDVHAAADPNRKSRGFLTVRDVQTQLTEGFVIAGDPQRCVDTIRHWREQVGLTALSGTFHFGGMPQELALKNIRLFAERVLPAFRS
ncbi:MAG TPA: LLM class flavin-dependent oxidoreductase [Candidatus Binatia bacterium]|jgi:alkanesulfonate monooxygenase SsuD/methylene tetrahydromethanopterin reductase-like flavin-dependent oxidoreductase (luciferase family)|nr:LLM class flavin-dependent oxidoreductase [Candidatus Binatia bacterium]